MKLSIIDKFLESMKIMEERNFDSEFSNKPPTINSQKQISPQGGGGGGT